MGSHIIGSREQQQPKAFLRPAGKPGPGSRSWSRSARETATQLARCLGATSLSGGHPACQTDSLAGSLAANSLSASGSTSQTFPSGARARGSACSYSMQSLGGGGSLARGGPHRSLPRARESSSRSPGDAQLAHRCASARGLVRTRSSRACERQLHRRIGTRAPPLGLAPLGELSSAGCSVAATRGASRASRASSAGGAGGAGGAGRASLAGRAGGAGASRAAGAERAAAASRPEGC